MHNPALNPDRFALWTLRDKAAQRRLALEWLVEKNQFPPILLLRRYLKLAIEMSREKISWIHHLPKHQNFHSLYLQFCRHSHSPVNYVCG